jgi:GntR family transcriptional regulator, transcriptional repressor for pyruvate dehydrogenase complex
MPRHSSDDRKPSADELTAALGGNVAGTTAVAEVTRRLLDFFTTGTLQPGDRLPPERQLAISMGVGRSAVREALAAMELLGVVDVRPGSGTYLRGRAVRPRPASSSTSDTVWRCRLPALPPNQRAGRSLPNLKTS